MIKRCLAAITLVWSMNVGAAPPDVIPYGSDDGIHLLSVSPKSLIFLDDVNRIQTVHGNIKRFFYHEYRSEEPTKLYILHNEVDCGTPWNFRVTEAVTFNIDTGDISNHIRLDRNKISWTEGKENSLDEKLWDYVCTPETRLASEHLSQATPYDAMSGYMQYLSSEQENNQQE